MPSRFQFELPIDESMDIRSANNGQVVFERELQSFIRIREIIHDFDAMDEPFLNQVRLFRLHARDPITSLGCPIRVIDERKSSLPRRFCIRVFGIIDQHGIGIRNEHGIGVPIGLSPGNFRPGYHNQAAFAR